MDTWLLWFIWTISVIGTGIITWYLTRKYYQYKAKKLARQLRSGHKEQVSKIIDKFIGKD